MKPVRILIVDDEVVFANNMTRLLRNRSYEAVAVHSGASALDLLADELFDVVVLDLKMPGLNGIATLREIKRTGNASEVLILTGHGDVESALEAMRLGAYDYLAKPCEIDALVAKIEGAFVKKDDHEQAVMEEKIRRLVESPLAILDMMPPKKSRDDG